MHLGPYRIKADWGHLALAGFIASFCLWYLNDARSSSPRADNLLLILPASLLAIVLFVIIVVKEIKLVRIAPDVDSVVETTGRGPAIASNLHVPAFMGIMGMYVLSMPYIGFDVATFLFMASSLLIQGERRWPVIVGFSLVFAVLVTWSFKMILSAPVPTMFG